MVEHAVFDVLPVLVCRREQTEEVDFPGSIEELKANILPGVHLSREIIITDEKELVDVGQHISGADAILLYKPYLGLGDCVRRITEFNRPVILFNRAEIVWTPLDALEYVYPRTDVWVAVDFEGINAHIKSLEAKKKIGNTRLLILNADYPHCERWLSRVRGGTDAIKETFGIEIERIQSHEVMRRWQDVDRERSGAVADEWMKGADKIIEPRKNDVELVARLYLAMKDFLNEEKAQGLTMAYGDDPLPVPCLAYSKLRDEGIPSACEADITSLILMSILHYLVDKPSFMGNISAYPRNNILRISHCTAPTRMAGYDRPPHPYILRDQHWGLPKGVLSAFIPMGTDQEVTICRLDGELKSMVVTKGRITACRDLEENCRITVDVEIGDVRKLIHNTSGNHQIMVYGDCTERIRELNELSGITTVKI